MIFSGESSLHRALRDYVAHYNAERPHQGVGNEVLERGRQPAGVSGRIRCDERLGGLLKHHRRAV
jgi:hypothetical protein